MGLRYRLLVSKDCIRALPQNCMSVLLYKSYLKLLRSDSLKGIFDFQEVRSCPTMENLSLVVLQSHREAEAVPVPAEGVGQDRHHT